MVRNELEMCNGHSVLKRVCGTELEPVMCDGHAVKLWPGSHPYCPVSGNGTGF